MKIFTWSRFAFIIIFLHFTLVSYSQSFEWAKRAGLWAFDYGYGVCADDIGNVYVAGKYEMNAKFGNITVSCEGNHDIFITKYDPFGNLLWVKTAGGLWGDYAHAITCDGAGNVYITGEFEVDTYFDDDTLKTWGGNDIFIAKYSTEGDLIWARRAGGAGNDKGQSIALSGNYLYIAGRIKDTAYFGNTQLISAGDQDIFLVKMDTEGNFYWAERAGGAGEDKANGVAVDYNGDIYITGQFNGNATFGTNTLTSFGVADIFLAKYDASGNEIWVKNAGGQYSDFGTALKTGDNGQIYITGGFRSLSQWDSISLSTQGVNSDIFVACYNSSGEVQWVKKSGGSLNDAGMGLGLDRNSNIYVTGHFGSTALFDTIMLQSADSADIFVASYSSLGDIRWALQATGTTDSTYQTGTEEAGRALWVDNAGNVIVTGSFRTNAQFGNTFLNGWMHTDVFVTTINQSDIMLTAAITPGGTIAFCDEDNIILSANTGINYSWQWYRNGLAISGADTSIYTANQGGNYTVQITDLTNTALSNATAITALDMPVASFTYWVAGMQINFSSQSANATSWLWDFGDGQTSFQENPTHEFFISQSYHVCLNAINNCGSDTFCMDITPTGIGNQFNASVPELAVYPNPTDGTVHLVYKATGKGNLVITIRTITGKLIYKNSLMFNNELRQEIDLRKEARGLYLLEITNDTETITKKLILD
ncbi:MAG: SBBP repeat-containing protein [Bacteroidota bacterium]|nr:SBBP repeat-containing protein [Bacteroidota bacterium]